MTGVDYDKMVRTISETVSNQMNVEINSLRSRINKLESKLEQEITKRQGLEEEVRRLKDNNSISSSSSPSSLSPSLSSSSSSISPSPLSSSSPSPLSSSSPSIVSTPSQQQQQQQQQQSSSQVVLPKKPNSFLRGNTESIPNNTNNNNNSNNNNSNNALPPRITRNIRTYSDVGTHPPNGLLKHSPFPSSEERQAMKSSDESKSGWVKAPLPRESDSKLEVHDTVLFDTASDRTIREGSLEKMGKTRQSWKVRWFRLQQGNLFYYKSPKDKKPIGDISLQNCSVFRSNIKRAYEFTISVPSRDWLFAARDEEEAEQWVEAVKSCSTYKGSIHYT